MRGLKPCQPFSVAGQRKVASFTDAWIETEVVFEFVENEPVASFTDAWIETKLQNAALKQTASHPLRMRGLKHILYHKD